MRPWSTLPIHDNGEPLEPLPSALLRLEPHPYQSLGAPYGAGASPFRLRRGVIDRLMAAQAALQHPMPDWRLAIFDAWRPVTVQQFMVEHAFAEECRARGLDPSAPGLQGAAVRAAVARFWAPPSTDPATPPPHSTGAAVDLTLAQEDGTLLAMGGEIDAIGSESDPDHYAETALLQDASPEATWHRRRCLLAGVMEEAGFVRHPNEWWHFSHGDQLWAWRGGHAAAFYGRTSD
jgi:D-alanyl-D-alanine dipeptidase